MRKLVFLVFFVSICFVNAAERDMHHRPWRLKDGSYLFVNMDDTMDMMDKNGESIKMQDGVEMELEDGTLIMMKNKNLWYYSPEDMKK